MDPTTTAPTTDSRTFGFRIAHAALRRDVERLLRAVPRVAGDADAEAVRSWFDRFATMLVHHHEIEDDIWWPAIAAAVPGFAERGAAMRDEHAVLDAAISSTRAALAALAAAPPAARPAARHAAAAAAAHLACTTVDHLDAEEAAVFPALARLDDAAVAEAERFSGRRDTYALVRFGLPWALDAADPALAAELRSSIPAPLRLLARRWERRYRRQLAAFLALAG